MPYNFGSPQLYNKIAQLVTGITVNKLAVTKTMNMVTDNRFYGRPGDAVTLRVAKPLPVRQYDLNNDRNEPLKMDRLEYSTQTLTSEADRIYSAVGITDEDFDFSILENWAGILSQQATALSNGFERSALSMLTGAKYEIVRHVDISTEAIKAAIEIGQDAVLNAILETRSLLSRAGSPIEFNGGFALAGSEWALLLRKNQRLSIAEGTGDHVGAFASAAIGTYAGLTIIESPHINPRELYVYTKDAFNVWSAAPSVPYDVYGSTFTQDNLSLRWLFDYASAYGVRRSYVSAYTGFGVSEDFVEAFDQAGQPVLSDEKFFVRGAKMVLGRGNDVIPGNGQGTGAGASADSFLAKRFNNEPVVSKAGAGVYADLTYQNVMEGHVSAGKPAAVEAPAGYAPEEVNEVVPGEED